MRSGGNNFSYVPESLTSIFNQKKIEIAEELGPSPPPLSTPPHRIKKHATYPQKTVEQKREPVRQHFLCNGVGASKQQLGIIAAFHCTLDQLRQ